MRILAIDTSSLHGSVAFLAGTRVLAEESGALPEPSSSGLFRRVSSVLGKASTKLSEIDCFAVAAGPGSLTAVKGWAEVWQKPVAAVSVLEAVAAQATEPVTLLAPLTDARRGLLFCGAYRRVSPAGGAASEDRARPEELNDLQQASEEFIATPPEILDRFLSAAADPPLFVTPSPEAAVAIVACLACRNARIEMVSPDLAPVIARLGLRQALRGKLVDALGLNANYIQRSAAEVNWKEPA